MKSGFSTYYRSTGIYEIRFQDLPGKIFTGPSIKEAFYQSSLYRKSIEMPRIDHLNHKPDEAGIEAIEQLRVKIIELDKLISDLLPVGRERSLALTELELVRMWAVKGVAMQYPAQEIGERA